MSSLKSFHLSANEIRRLGRKQMATFCFTYGGSAIVVRKVRPLATEGFYFTLHRRASRLRLDCSYWSDDTSPFLYGTVVRFERLVIRSGHYSTQVWSLVSYLIDREFARRGSILMLKAFPLEYERQTTQAPRSVYKRLRRRKLAMERYYTYRLGTRSVPGPYGKDGWMWRPLRHCEPPARWKRYKL